MTAKISKETQEQAMKVAKATQKKGQTKEQTKLIAQGIEKGIAEYKKQQSKKARERDKLRKAKLKAASQVNVESEAAVVTEPKHRLPWILLALSWTGFIGFYLLG